MTDEDLGDTLDNIEKEQANDWKNKGNEYYKQGQYGDALYCYDKALGIVPDFTDAWNNKGMALVKLGRIEEAKQCREMLKNVQNPPKNDQPVSEPTKRSKNKPFKIPKIAIVAIVAIFVIAALVVIAGAIFPVTSKDPIIGQWGMPDITYPVDVPELNSHIIVKASRSMEFGDNYEASGLFRYYNASDINQPIEFFDTYIGSWEKSSPDHYTLQWENIEKNTYYKTTDQKTLTNNLIYDKSSDSVYFSDTPNTKYYRLPKDTPVASAALTWSLLKPVDSGFKPKYVKGDVVSNEDLLKMGIAVIILNYDPNTVQYKTNTITKDNNGNWNQHPSSYSKYDDAWIIDETYLKFVQHQNL